MWHVACGSLHFVLRDYERANMIFNSQALHTLQTKCGRGQSDALVPYKKLKYTIYLLLRWSCDFMHHRVNACARG